MSTQPETVLIYRADAIEAVAIPYQLRSDEAARHLIELDQAITDATETEVGQDMLFVEVSVDVAKTAYIRLQGYGHEQNDSGRWARFKAAEDRIHEALRAAGIR